MGVNGAVGWPLGSSAGCIAHCPGPVDGKHKTTAHSRHASRTASPAAWQLVSTNPASQPND